MNFPSKFKSRFCQHLNTHSQVQFQKNLKNRFREKKTKVLLLSPKNDTFFFKIQNSHFKALFNVSYQVRFQKNPMNRFREKKKNKKKHDFGPENATFTIIWVQ